MTRGPVRFLWIAGASLMAAVILFTGTLAAVNALARDTETITTVFDEPDVRLLDIELNSGSVTVMGSSQRAITVTAEITHGLRRSKQQVAVEGDRVVIRESCGHALFASCQADYTVQVPIGVHGVVRSRNGSISISDIDGAMDASSSNGSVTASRMAGDLRLRSSNGRVQATALSSDVVDASSSNGRVNLVFVDAPRDVVAESSNGRIDVVLPRTEAAYRVDASSSNGEVDTPVRTDPSSERTILAESRNGSVTVRYPAG